MVLAVSFTFLEIFLVDVVDDLVLLRSSVRVARVVIAIYIAKTLMYVTF